MVPNMVIHRISIVILLLQPLIWMVVAPSMKRTVKNMKDVYDDCDTKIKNQYCVGSKGNFTSFPGDGCLASKNCDLVVLAFRNDGKPNIFIAHRSEPKDRGFELGGKSDVAFTNQPMKWKRASEARIADDLEFAEETIYFHVYTGAYGDDVGSEKSKKAQVLKKEENSKEALFSEQMDGEILSQVDNTSGLHYTLARFKVPKVMIGQTNLDKKVVLSAVTYTYNYQSNNLFPETNENFATRIDNISPSKIWEMDYSTSGASNLTWLWVILAIAFILLLILLIWCLVRKKKQPKPVSGVDSEATLRSKMPSGTAVSKARAVDAKSTGSKTSATSKTGATASATETSTTGGAAPVGSKAAGSNMSASKRSPSKTSTSKTSSKTSSSKV